MKLIEVTLAVEIEDDTNWEYAAGEIVDAVREGPGQLVLSVHNWTVGDEWTQL